MSRVIVARLLGSLSDRAAVEARAAEMGAVAVRGVHEGPDFLLRGIAILSDEGPGAVPLEELRHADSVALSWLELDR